MSYLRPIRLSCLALLTTLGGVLLVWQARRASRPAQGWMGSAFLMAAVAALLMLDRHPLRSAEQCARASGLGAPSMPSNFQPLATLRASTPRPLPALAAEEGLLPATGPRLSWSAPDRRSARG